MRRVFLVICCCVLSLASAASRAEPSAAEAPNEAVQTNADAYQVPERIGELELARLSDLQPAGAGLMARYATPAVRVDFFVYSALNLPPEVSVANALWWEYEHLKHGVAEAARRDALEISLVREAAQRVATVDGEIDAVQATYELAARHGARAHSVAYLALLRTDFVKMRASWRPAPDEATADLVEAAQREFYAKLTPRVPRAKLDLVQTLAVDFNATCGFAGQAMVGIVLSDLLDRGHTLHTLERSVALAESFIAGEGFLSVRCTARSLQALAMAKRAGVLRESMWSTVRPSFWADPGDLQLETFEKLRRRKLKRAPKPQPDFGVTLRFRRPGAESAEAARAEGASRAGAAAETPAAGDAMPEANSP
jgi:hypothetical protein